MEYKAFTGLPWNDAIRAMLPADARGPGAGMTFFALNNPQPDKPSPGSITLYCLKEWAGTMYLPEGELATHTGTCDGRVSNLSQQQRRIMTGLGC
jgi:hypothetical protein